MAKVTCGCGPDPSEFERKAENITKGKWGSLTIGTRLVIWVHKIRAVLGNQGSAMKIANAKMGAVKKLIKKTYGEEVSSLNGRTKKEIGKALTNVVEKVGKVGLAKTNLDKLSYDLQSSVIDTEELKQLGQKYAAFANTQMQSDMPKEGVVQAKEGSFVFHGSKGEHEGGRNEDAYAVTQNCISVADGVSDGKLQSGQISRLFADVTTRVLDKLVISPLIDDMSGDDVLNIIKEDLQVAGKAFNRDFIDELNRNPDLLLEQVLYEKIGQSTTGATTGISVGIVSKGEGKSRLVGMAVGDVSGTRINLKKKSAETLYKVASRRNTSDPGGDFSAFGNIYAGQKVSEPSFDPDSPPVAIDATVEEGELVVLASDALYDNLPGKTTEEKNEALLYIMTNPKFDDKRGQNDTAELPTLADVKPQAGEFGVSEEQATIRIRNYLDYHMPTSSLSGAYKGDKAKKGKQDDFVVVVKKV